MMKELLLIICSTKIYCANFPTDSFGRNIIKELVERLPYSDSDVQLLPETFETFYTQ